MTIDEAIAHCRENEVNEKSKGNLSCSQEHHQLAEWLTELKNIRAAVAELKSKFANLKADILSREDPKEKRYGNI